MQDTPFESGDAPNQPQSRFETDAASIESSTNDTIYCPRCGEKNLENNYKCTRCGFVLHESPIPQVTVSNEDTLTSLIPIKNKQALISYYLGIFSLIPILGIPLGLTALVLGIRGLNFAKIHPDAKGAIHAWVGTILGGIFGIGYILLIAIPIILSL